MKLKRYKHLHTRTNLLRRRPQPTTVESDKVSSGSKKKRHPIVYSEEVLRWMELHGKPNRYDEWITPAERVMMEDWFEQLVEAGADSPSNDSNDMIPPGTHRDYNHFFTRALLKKGVLKQVCYYYLFYFIIFSPCLVHPHSPSLCVFHVIVLCVINLKWDCLGFETTWR